MFNGLIRPGNSIQSNYKYSLIYDIWSHLDNIVLCKLKNMKLYENIIMPIIICIRALPRQNNHTFRLGTKHTQPLGNTHKGVKIEENGWCHIVRRAKTKGPWKFCVFRAAAAQYHIDLGHFGLEFRNAVFTNLFLDHRRKSHTSIYSKDILN